MEYVEGQPIDRYCDARQLGVDERLELFLDVCEAVQYAHRNLVVHRDLKPSNILVTGPANPAPGTSGAEAGGQVKLLDFGIAKLLDPGRTASAGLTVAGTRMLTLAYTSPEQIRGETVTTASDVYTLGVLLYELLTGCHPHPAGSPDRAPHEVERRILEQEPERPSVAATRPAGPAAARGTSPERLRRRLRGDLDTIILQALRKEPERHYATAEQLAADIRGHLAGRPVGARRDSWEYRAGKFIRRNRLAVAAGLAFVLLLIVSSAVTAVQAERLARENQKTEQVAALLTELFAVSDPDRARGQAVTARELLDRGAERVERELAGQPEVEARMLDAMGVAYRGLGEYDSARALLERSLAIRRRLHAGDDADIAATSYNLASVLRFRGDFEPAEALFRDALAMRRRLFGDRHPAVVESLNGLGFVLRGRRADAEAESVYREALASGQRVYEGPHLQVADVLNGLGGTL
ncbi:hypothetical protein BH23GEM3_BH23GEM3_09430 [soil metagenome]